MKFITKPRCAAVTLLVMMLASGWTPSRGLADDQAAPLNETTFTEQVQPLLEKYCLKCHSEEERKGELDLQRFKSLAIVRKDVRPWQALIEQLEAGEMPPKDELQPSAAERKQLIQWTRRLLDNEARARAGDPGRVPLRRISNAEFDYGIRDLTGVDLRPAREFPSDGAAGEGFTNAAEALSMSPAMMNKYLGAAKEIAAHAVLLPDGFRFSPHKTRRDWTDESLVKLRAFYRQFTSGAEGELPLSAHLSALARHRNALDAGDITLETVSASEKLSAKYLTVLWQMLNNDDAPRSFALESIRARWKNAAAQDVNAIVAEINAAQTSLWNSQPIGSYRYGNLIRRVAKDPAIVPRQTIRPDLEQAQLAGIRTLPGHTEVVLRLVAHDLLAAAEGSHALWIRPRFEREGQPTLLLRDYAEFGSKYEVDYSRLFKNTAKYLAAAIEAANDPDASPTTLAAKHKLDAAWLARWIDLVALKPRADKAAYDPLAGRVVPLVPLKLLDEKTPKNDQRPAINGWKPQGADLPVLVSNSSDKTEHIPGRASPHQVMVHPTPDEFIAVAWASPIKGRVRVDSKISHAHPNCGNGVAWWLEKQTTHRGLIFAEGTVDLGAKATPAPVEFNIDIGEKILLAIDARDRSHVCDLTEIALSIFETGGQKRVWNLAVDIADNIQDGNPHADGFGNQNVWSAVRGPSGQAADKSYFGGKSTLELWCAAAQDKQHTKLAAELGNQLQVLLNGVLPADKTHPDRKLYDRLVSLDGPLLKDFAFETKENGKPRSSRLGLAPDAFGNRPGGTTVDDASVVVPFDEVLELRLPAALLRDRDFVVDCGLIGQTAKLAVQFHVAAANRALPPRWNFQSPIVAQPSGPGHQRALAEIAEFRRIFPPLICYPHVIPLDEVVCLKTFHREDEPLARLFLDDEQSKQIDRLWNEHRFISKFPVVENEYLPLFIGFVTQDQSKQLVDYFESQRKPFQERADRFEAEFNAAATKQLAQLCDFAARAYRRPLTPGEQAELTDLYQTLRKKAVSHEDAVRNVLTRVLISPSFLLHLEQAPPGQEARAVNDWELASRLSFFLWSSVPDEELREVAAAGKLRDPEILATQTRRMLKDDRVRALAIEFGTQWIHVRGFGRFNEKNEQLFPGFDENLRAAIYEESILFFQDLFQSNGVVTQIVDADHAYLNGALAAHYGIPGVEGADWRRVDGVQQYGRGGILGLASVQAKQAGASRTSPVLRGNWVVETLLGEKLPRPPPNVPQLPEAETGNDGLTMRQLVEMHVRAPECASCHQRIDPFGFAFEAYDPIGRLRQKDLGGLPVDLNVTLHDGTKFTGISGLREYLLTTKKDAFVRLFCQRLLGYSLARSVTLSDQLLLDEMLVSTRKDGGGRMSDLVLAIVQSPQFRMIRGSAFEED